MKKLNSKGISHLLIPLMVVVVGVAAFGTYQLVSSSADSKKCNVKFSNGRITGKNGNWTGTTIVKTKCNFREASLSDNTISFCQLGSRTNPRDHGACFPSKSAERKGNQYVLKMYGKGVKPKGSYKVVVIVNPGDKPHYGFSTLR